MNRHKPKIILAVIVALIGVVLVVRACLPTAPGRNLLAQATKLAAVRDVISYSWISNTELIVPTSTNGYPTMRFPWTGSVASLDSSTGKWTPLNGLTAAIMQHAHRYDPLGPWNYSQSQDGQWLMWVRGDPKDGGEYPVTARRDGSGYHEWNLFQSRQTRNEGNWIDNRHWITILYPKPDLAHPENSKPTGVILHDAAQPASDRRLPASSPEAQAWMHASEHSFFYPEEPHRPALYADPSQKAFSLDLAIMTVPSAAPTGTRPTRLDTVSFPAGTKILDNLPNPQGSCIELLVRETGIPPYVTLLRKLFPRYPYLAHPTEALYVYRTDNRKFVEIGCVPETSSTSSDIANAFWQPDGKHIQFFYHQAVYIVSTE